MSSLRPPSFDLSHLASASPPDLRLRSDMWKGQIPVMFTLAPHEVTSMEDPPPLAMFVPRQSYFPLVLSAVRAHFQDVTPAMEDELWLEYEGVPLKWNIPIGVLYDLLVPSTAGPTAVDSLQGTSSSSVPAPPPMTLPWRLVVHFQSFPTSKLLRCRALYTVRAHYVNTWKESAFLRFASNRVAQQCSPQEHQRLWDSLLQLREDVHVQTMTRLISQAVMTQHAAQAHAAGSQQAQLTPALLQAALENRSVESLAIRTYLHCTRPAHEEGANSETHCCPVQRPMRSKSATTGHDHTLGDYFALHFPSLLAPTPPAAADSNSQPASPTASYNVSPASSPSLSLLPHVRVLVQGFCPPLSTPLWWLCTYASHPDSFLYITVHIAEAETEEERAARDPFGTGHGGHDMGMGMGMSSSGMWGGGGGGMGSGSFSGMSGLLGFGGASTLPGYHAASNALNVVYQNLPAIPSVASFFAPQQQQQQQQQQPPSHLSPASYIPPHASSFDGVASSPSSSASGPEGRVSFSSSAAPGSSPSASGDSAQPILQAEEQVASLLADIHIDEPGAAEGADHTQTQQQQQQQQQPAEQQAAAEADPTTAHAQEGEDLP